MHIEGESRTSTAVVDPTGGTYTEINEWGPAVSKDELEMLLEKLHYLTQGAELVVFAGSLPRDVQDDFYAEAIHDLARRHVPVVLDTEGEPLRLGVEAEPFLVSPNQREAEALVGQEFHDDEDFRLALDQIAELGARNVIDHDRDRLRRAPPRGARRRAGSAPSRRGSSRCRRSARATCCSPHSSPPGTPGARPRTRSVPRSPRARRRPSRSAPGGSTRAQAGRLQAGVEITELEPVEVSRARSRRLERAHPGGRR